MKNIKKEVVHIKGRRPREITSVYDEKGNVVHRLVTPLMTLFRAHDVVQVIVGASLLAIPMAYTEETWRLGEMLSAGRVVWLAVLSVVFITIFVYYNFYKEHVATNVGEFLKRVISVYVLSLIVVALFLTIIDKAPWTFDWVLALKRVFIIAVPASMSATVADMIK